jgi:hypothetical protein
MTRGRLKSLGVNPDAGQTESMPYDADSLKAIVASGKLV